MGSITRRLRKKMGLTTPRPEYWEYKKRPEEKRENEVYDQPESNRITAEDREVTEGLTWQAWDGEYKKEHYFIRYKDGDRMVLCWPNAGYMNSSDGSGRVWSPDPAFEVVSATIAGWDWEDDR